MRMGSYQDNREGKAKSGHPSSQNARTGPWVECASGRWNEGPGLSESQQLTLPDGRAVSALWAEGRGNHSRVVVYAPGAGSTLADPFGAFLASELPEAGIGCLRFQFPYMEGHRRLPDPPKVLEATWWVAVAAARQRGPLVVATGRSMGGRIASQIAAQGADVDALVCFAYPLHPPGRPDQRRDGHLAQIGAPILFCSGTRDSFASPEELQGLVSGLRLATLHLLEAADHGFSVRKSSGRTREAVWHEASGTLIEWLGGL